MDSTRIGTEQTAAQTAAQQLAALASLITKRLLVVADRYYGSAAFIKALLAHQAGVAALLRIKSDRVFYRQAPVKQEGQRGAPRKDGARFKCSDETTHGPPDRTYQSFDEQAQLTEVAAWDNLHFRQERTITISVIRVTRHGASGKKGQPRVSWFIWPGSQPLPLEKVVPIYQRRFSLEHCFRFKKQDLLWDKARLRTPEQFELWSQLVAFVLNQLVLAQPLNQAQLRPWESARRKASPQQVRRGMAAIISYLGTPARTPKPRGKAAGRLVGTVVRPAKRYAVVKKSCSKVYSRQKRA